ncbi:hypothetical protein APR41_10635 [Salegentibacter salinarum]|uniref:Response regulatory domain-containing protein n=1 Tax=Salegentibacter salinarum TaxID=447422 RepID=A0A2N0TND5_9FLAO|nr:hypothetical protein APR41_10635 [Salegentibacter salinarum]
MTSLCPGVSRYEVLKNLAKNKETANIPFIFLSAKSDNREKSKGINLGSDDFISKPFSAKDLLEAIKSRLA